jgi:hypothetical protein
LVKGGIIMNKKIKCHVVKKPNYKPVKEWTVGEILVYAQTHDLSGSDCSKCPFTGKCFVGFEPCEWG